MNIFKQSIIFVGFLVTLYSCNVEKIRNKKPNIIFLLTDDQRWDAMGAMGNPLIKTPNMDQLANNGVLFKNTYVTTSICCCSRASILSGQYVSRHGINGFRTPFSPEALSKTYPMILKDNGYKVGFIGKYGVGNPQDFPDSLYHYWGCDFRHQPDYENTDSLGNMVHYTDIVSERMEDFLDKFGEENPFCLSVSFKAPHCQDGDPRQFIYAERYRNLYTDVDFPLPETADSSYYYRFPEEFRKPVFKGKARTNEARNRWDLRFKDKEMYQETVRSYYRLITGVDDAIGKLLVKLEEIGEADNTIIVFMGDNGFYLGEHGMAGKWYPHRESIRVPFFVFDPRNQFEDKGIKVNKVALNIDVAPTILSLAGIEIPSVMQGVNAMSLLSDDPEERNEFYYEHKLDIPTVPHSEAVISKHFKYINYPNLITPFEELYDIQSDPLEKVNLAGNDNYKPLLEQYRAQMNQLRNDAK